MRLRDLERSRNVQRQFDLKGVYLVKGPSYGMCYGQTLSGSSTWESNGSARNDLVWPWNLSLMSLRFFPTRYALLHLNTDGISYKWSNRTIRFVPRVILNVISN